MSILKMKNTSRLINSTVMKRILSLLLICIMLCGCGSMKNPADPQDADSGEVIVTTADPNDKREVVTLGMIDAIPLVMREVNAFNETNEKYRIEVITHPSMEYEDYHANHAMKIMTGRGEDLLYLGGDNRIKDYIEKGVLVDLHFYIQRDLEEEDYFQEVLYAYSKGDGIYAVSPYFTMQPLWGRKEELGNGDVRFEDLAGIMEKSQAVSLMGRDSMYTLWYLYSYFGMELTDRQELKEGILLAEKYRDRPELADPDDNGRAYFGKTFLVAEHATDDPNSILRLEEAYGVLGETMQVITGGSMHCAPYGIYGESEKKEGAWEFIRFLLSEERQAERINRNSLGFPISRKAFDERTEAAYEWIEKNDPVYEVLRNPLNKERYMEIMGTWLRGSKPLEMGIDYDAWKIVSEEAEAYYSGQKPLDTVLDTIESRMRLYLSE